LVKSVVNLRGTFGKPDRFYSSRRRAHQSGTSKRNTFSGGHESLRGAYSGSQPGYTEATERAAGDPERDLQRSPLAKLASRFTSQAAQHSRSDFEGQASRHEIGGGIAEKFPDRCTEFSRSAFWPVHWSGDVLLENVHPLFWGRRVHLLSHFGLRGASQCARRAIEARDDPARD
jgi:hypothetical protein